MDSLDSITVQVTSQDIGRQHQNCTNAKMAPDDVHCWYF